MSLEAQNKKNISASVGFADWFLGLKTYSKFAKIVLE